MNRKAKSFASFAGAVVALALAAEAGAAVRMVRNDGTDAPGCGASGRPCRSITAALESAADGDRIVVGPGRYGDLNGNGVSDPGDETFEQGCNCLVNVDKRVTVESEKGAAATVIDGGGDPYFLVSIAADGAVFGKPGKGFTLTRGQVGVVVFAGGTAVAGNHAVKNSGTGFSVSVGLAGSQAANRVLRNVATENGSIGFSTYGALVLSRNVAVANLYGFEVQGDHAVVTGNLATGNEEVGFQINFGPHVFTGNSAIANRGIGIWTQILHDTALTGNNVYGNDGCGLRNSTGGTLDARGSYWGAPGGPGDDPADRVCDDGASSTTTSDASDKELPLKAPNLK
ncbi:MAG TPA: right-handed parallel beta-helix repeat-containing protein [Candidatus Binatia bacterium]|nr:right-handed parallel beta-helix repeat-containing protein [Candidatus Binatia bacterium]